MKTPFFGPFDVTRSTNLADNQLINLYPTLGMKGSAKDVGALYGTPGLTPITTMPEGPIRPGGLRNVNGTLYVVTGTGLYSLGTNLVATALGAIGASGPVTMVDDLANLAVFAPNLWVWSINNRTLTNVSLPFTPSGAATVQDDFFLAGQVGTPLFFNADLSQPTSWNALNFGEVSGQVEPLNAMVSINREVFMLQNTHTEIWVDAGLFPGTPFQRLDGVYIEYGIAAPQSLAKAADSLIWLAWSNDGQRQVIEVEGFRPRILSNEAIETIFQGYSTVADAVGFAYQQDGHSFYQLTFPTANETWVIDRTLTAQMRMPMWHRRASFANGAFSRHWANAYAFWNGMCVVGDYRNGNIYQYDLTNNLDNGAQRKWVRSWRALPQATQQPVKFTSLTIDMQTGIGVPDGTSPLVVLRHSDDGGHNWSYERFASAGNTGETARRIKFNRLGSTRRNSGLDRIFELSSTDNFPARLIGAELE